MKTWIAILTLLVGMGLGGLARAESSYTTGGGNISSSSDLDLNVTIPKFLYLRVGTGTNFANNTTINLISFTVPANQLGNGSSIAATAGSGDLGNGVVTARVIGNNGNVQLTATTGGALGNGAGDSINYNEITTTVSALTSGTALPAPALANGTSTITVPATAKVVNRDARWTYSYDNSSMVAPGTYGGVNTNNGRVVYTASMP